MENELNKEENKIISIREELKKEKENKNPAMTSPFEAPVGDIKPAFLPEVSEMKADLAGAIEKNDVREIFDYFDIGVFIQKDGSLGISEYRQPSPDITFSDLGIDEEKLIENVVKISGNSDFRKSSLNNFGKISYIGGCADFRNSNFNFNMKLPKIMGKIIFRDHQTLPYGLFMKFIYVIRQHFNK